MGLQVKSGASIDRRALAFDVWDMHLVVPTLLGDFLYPYGDCRSRNACGFHDGLDHAICYRPLLLFAPSRPEFYYCVRHTCVRSPFSSMVMRDVAIHVPEWPRRDSAFPCITTASEHVRERKIDRASLPRHCHAPGDSAGRHGGTLSDVGSAQWS